MTRSWSIAVIYNYHSLSHKALEELKAMREKKRVKRNKKNRLFTHVERETIASLFKKHRKNGFIIIMRKALLYNKK